MRAGNPKIYVATLFGLVLVGALAVLILFFALAEDAPKQDQEVSGGNSTLLPSLTIHTPTATSTNTPFPTATPRPATPTLLPTAAVDDISDVLQTSLTVDTRSSIVVGISPYTITGTAGRTEVLGYVVRRGDTLSNIAREFGLNLCTLVWSNPWSKISPLMPGVILDILPMDGVRYHVTRNTTIQQIAQETNVHPEEIINYAPNDLLDDSPETTLLEGMTITVPGGSYGECMIWSPTDAVAGETSYSGQVGLLRGCQYDPAANPGYPQISPLPGGYRFTQYFNPFHSGVDLAVRVGTPVYATGSGTISFAARHRSGYSNTIVIDHGTGFYTLYAHLSAINVTCGEVVSQGDIIGYSGNEGNSSGPHLHFEIRNGSFDPVDPLSYIGL